MGGVDVEPRFINSYGTAPVLNNKSNIPEIKLFYER
jgi:hypothetical protein